MPYFHHTSTAAGVTKILTTERTALIAAARRLEAAGLTAGTAGNLSLRVEGGILITPSAIPYADITPDMVPLMQPDGSYTGAYRPSSEWRFHADILGAHPAANAVVHNHAPYCTALAIARREIPACHYMVARFGGDSVRCAPYATFGTAELSALALAALAGRSACLLANHGAITTAASLAGALAAAIELEALAQHYLLSLAAGPVLLTAAEMAAAHEQFATAYRPNTPTSRHA